MKQDDARKLDHATLEAMRIRAVRSVQAGENPEVVARSLRISRRTIYGWLAQYRGGGWGALKAKPLFGRPPKLNARANQTGARFPPIPAARLRERARRMVDRLHRPQPPQACPKVESVRGAAAHGLTRQKARPDRSRLYLSTFDPALHIPTARLSRLYRQAPRPMLDSAFFLRRCLPSCP